MIVNVEENQRHTDENKGSAYGIIGTENGCGEFFVPERVTKSDEEENKEGDNNDVVKTS